jgi:hypothetical protein
VFNATFNNISVISWLSVLLVKETGLPGENHRPDNPRSTKYYVINKEGNKVNNNINIYI